MSDTTSIGDRMKEYYEDRTRYLLPRRTFTIVRVDGKAFHSFTRAMERPFDQRLMTVMDRTALALCIQLQGAKMAYVQSDEISVVLTDFDDLNTAAWFDGNVQKIVSVSASMATVAFNHECPTHEWGYAMFDARVFTIPHVTEVVNYCIWRQQDATRNSVQMAGQSQFSHKELHGVNMSQLQEKLFSEKGINWNDYPVGAKRGRCVIRNEGDSGPRWKIDESPPIFTQDRAYVESRVVPPSSPPETVT